MTRRTEHVLGGFLPMSTLILIVVIVQPASKLKLLAGCWRRGSCTRVRSRTLCCLRLTFAGYALSLPLPLFSSKTFAFAASFFFSSCLTLLFKLRFLPEALLLIRIVVLGINALVSETLAGGECARANLLFGWPRVELSTVKKIGSPQHMFRQCG